MLGLSKCQMLQDIATGLIWMTILFGGLLGIGGGVVIVPALILLFDIAGTFTNAPPGSNLTTLIAVATSLGSIIFTAAAAARSQIRARMVEWLVVRRWVPALVVGSYLAGFVAAELGVQILRLLIGVFLLFVSAVMRKGRAIS